MKTISLHQPWASLIFTGCKVHETRSWPTKYRGPLAIHAAKAWPRSYREMCTELPFATALTELLGLPADIFDEDEAISETSWEAWSKALDNAIPRGAILGTVKLVDCQPTTIAQPASDYDREFGDWRKGRFAWKLENPQLLSRPIPFAGCQRFFNFEI